MPWLDTDLWGPFLTSLAATHETAPTNASSLTLAFIGVGTWVVLGLGRRRFRRQPIAGAAGGSDSLQTPALKTPERRAA